MRVTEAGFRRLLTVTAAALIGAAFGTTNVFATALPVIGTGTLIIQNLPGTFAGFTSVPFCFNWAGGATCAGAIRNMSVSGTSDLFATPSTGTIKDLSSITASVTVFETVLGAGPLAGDTVNFDLASVPLTNGGIGFGNCSLNLGSCSPANSPFTFTEDNTGVVTIQFTAMLNAYTGTSTTGTTPYTAVFSTQEAGNMTGAGPCNILASITNILSCEAAGGTISGGFLSADACIGVCAADATIINGAWSAIETPVPEPVSFGLLGSGLLGLALGGRRLRRSKLHSTRSSLGSRIRKLTT